MPKAVRDFGIPIAIVVSIILALGTALYTYGEDRSQLSNELSSIAIDVTNLHEAQTRTRTVLDMCQLDIRANEKAIAGIEPKLLYISNTLDRLVIRLEETHRQPRSDRRDDG